MAFFSYLINRIVGYLQDHNLFSDMQHGFRKGRSCFSKILAHHDWVLYNLTEGKNMDVVFLDFAKAFGKVDYGILLHKVRAFSIIGKVSVWIHAFLTGHFEQSPWEDIHQRRQGLSTVYHKGQYWVLSSS